MKRYTPYYYDVFKKTPKGVCASFEKRCEQLGSCQAWVITLDNGTKILQSYKTFVAMVDNNGKIYCSGTYSRTTISHISRFARLFGLSYFDFKAVIK